MKGVSKVGFQIKRDKGPDAAASGEEWNGETRYIRWLKESPSERKAGGKKIRRFGKRRLRLQQGRARGRRIKKGV